MPPIMLRSSMLALAHVLAIALAIALAGAAAAAPLDAQEARGPGAVDPAVTGDRVRIVRDGVRRPQVHRFERLEGDTLILRDLETDALVRVPAWQVSRFERSRGARSRSAGAWRGLRDGFFVGLLVGGVTGAYSSSTSKYPLLTPAGAAVAVGAAGGVLGGTIGLFVGIAAPGERWEAVELRRPQPPAPREVDGG